MIICTDTSFLQFYSALFSDLDLFYFAVLLHYWSLSICDVFSDFTPVFLLQSEFVHADSDWGILGQENSASLAKHIGQRENQPELGPQPQLLQ